MPTQYCIYLRKSRADLEAEARGEADVLVTHRKTLLSLAEQRGYPIGKIYEEIVSGDTIADRPQMQQLLSEVEARRWHGVLVMEIERLARGDSIDQGIVTRAFKFSGTYIVTPAKIFDPNNYYDEEHLEFDLFMSRREYKMINRRLQAGRLAAARDGRWLGGKAPFGYDSQKLHREKGFSLVPNADAKTVQTIFQLFVDNPKMGTIRLCHRLNELGYRSATGKLFNVGIVKDILQNPVYAGFITWGRRGEVKIVKNGQVSLTYPRNKDYQVFQGRHEPLISQDVWNAAQAKLHARSFAPVPKSKQLQNPLSGLLICGSCGHKMQARPQAGTRYVFCHHYCGMVSSRIDEVEEALLLSLRHWLADYQAPSKAAAQPSGDQAALEASLQKLNAEIAAIEEQRARAFELVETGVYTPELFKERQAILSSRRDALAAAADQTRALLDQLLRDNQTRQALIPRVQSVIETYAQTPSAEDKNAMLRSIISKIVYNKTTGVYSPSGSDLSLTIYPLIPDTHH